MKLNVIWLPFDFKKIYTFPSALSYELFSFECQGLILSRREPGGSVTAVKALRA